jgi:transcriptional regulatory protein LEU3
LFLTLFKLFSPEFLPLLTEQQKREIISLVQKLVQILGSEHVAMHGRHTPALYSRFIDGLLSKYQLYARATTLNSPTDYMASQASPQWTSWPYTQDGHPRTISNSSSDFLQFSTNQRHGETGMDLSLPYFLQSVHTFYPFYNEQGDFSSM